MPPQEETQVSGTCSAEAVGWGGGLCSHPGDVPPTSSAPYVQTDGASSNLETQIAQWRSIQSTSSPCIPGSALLASVCSLRLNLQDLDSIAVDFTAFLLNLLWIYTLHLFHYLSTKGAQLPFPKLELVKDVGASRRGNTWPWKEPASGVIRVDIAALWSHSEFDSNLLNFPDNWIIMSKLCWLSLPSLFITKVGMIIPLHSLGYCKDLFNAFMLFITYHRLGIMLTMGKRNEGLSSCHQDADDVVQEMDTQTNRGLWCRVELVEVAEMEGCTKGCLGIFTEDSQKILLRENKQSPWWMVYASMRDLYLIHTEKPNVIRHFSEHKVRSDRAEEYSGCLKVALENTEVLSFPSCLYLRLHRIGT